MSDPKLVFGFDLGIASLGFAAVDLERHELIHMASHLFPAPQEPKTKASLAAKRRGYRSNRRNLERDKTRRNRCRRLLIDAGLVPDGVDPKWFETRQGDADVVVLRHRALSERITDRELARVLLYLCQHRQYIDQGKGSAEGSEDGKVLKALAGNRALMEQGDAETFGEVLYRRHDAGERTRNVAGDYELTIPHEMIRHEASLIIDRQIGFGNGKLDDSFKASYLSIVSSLKSTYERDLRIYGNVGTCTYHKDKVRAAKATLTSEIEECREKLAHVRIVGEGGTFPLPGAVVGTCTYHKDKVRAAKATLTSEIEECREKLAHVRIVGEGGTFPLPGAVRRAAVASVFDPMGKKGQTSLTYAMLRKLMNNLGADGPESMRETDHFKGLNDEKGERAVLFSAKRFAVIKASLGEDLGLLESLMADSSLYDDIAEALTFASSRESYERRLSDLGVDDRLEPAALDAVRGLPYGSAVFNGYGNRSRDALEILSGCLLEDGIDSLHQAEEAGGLLQKRVEDRRGKASLLPPYKTYDPTCTNPVVLRAAARFRAAFNEAVRAYGIPDAVRIELGRDLKCSAAEKAKISKGQKRNKDENDKARAAVAEILGVEQEEVVGRQIAIFRFYESQSGRDIYVDEPIDLERALKEPKYVEIDHILPFSRSCDDSKSNKVLCLSKSNQDKAGKTPFEWIAGSDESDPRWIAFCNRVEAVRKSIGGGKARKLTKVNFDDAAESGFIDRNLNDTRYLSCAIKNWVETSIAFPTPNNQHVFAVSGGATSILRRQWGLNFGTGGEKDRDDDRHHAVDAAVIAMCDPVLVKKCAKHGERRRFLSRDERDRLMGESMPWSTFADEVRARREFVIPTRSTSHTLRGCATDDTVYGYRGEKAKSKKGTMPLLSKGGKVKPSSTSHTLRGCATDDTVYGYRGEKAKSKKGTMPLLSKGGKVKPSSTAIRCGDGFKMQGDMAFIRLWLDPDAGSNGKWLVEPVYCSDYPSLVNGTYTPRYCAPTYGHRSNWPEIPTKVLEGASPVTMYKGDAVAIDGSIARFAGFDVSDKSFTWGEIIADGQASLCTGEILPLGKWDATTDFRVISEDALGFCWRSVIRSLG